MGFFDFNVAKAGQYTNYSVLTPTPYRSTAGVMNAVVHNNFLFTALTTTTFDKTSADLVSQSLTAPAGASSINAMNSFNGVLYVGGQLTAGSLAYIARSINDGASFTFAAIAGAPAAITRSIAVNRGTTLCARVGGDIYTSTDNGNNFVLTNSSGALATQDVSFDDQSNRFYAGIVTSGNIIWSEDGVTWNQVNTGTGVDIQMVIFRNGSYWAFPASGSGSSQFIYQLNGNYQFVRAWAIPQSNSQASIFGNSSFAEVGGKIYVKANAGSMIEFLPGSYVKRLTIADAVTSGNNRTLLFNNNVLVMTNTTLYSSMNK